MGIVYGKVYKRILDFTARRKDRINYSNYQPKAGKIQPTDFRQEICVPVSSPKLDMPEEHFQKCPNKSFSGRTPYYWSPLLITTNI